MTGDTKMNLDDFVGKMKSVADFDQMLRRVLLSGDVDPKMVDLVMARLQPIMLELPSLSVPPGTNRQAIEAISAFQDSATKGLCHLCLAYLEIEQLKAAAW